MSEFIRQLEAAGELRRISVPVSTHLEITEIADRMIKENGPALLFEQNGTNFPLLINAFGSDRRMAMAFGVEDLVNVTTDLEHTMQVLEKAGSQGLISKIPLIPEVLRLSRRLPKKHKGRGRCQEVVMPKPDLTRLPVLTCWPGDGGPFITFPLVHTVDPETGKPNTGMYRMQVYDAVTAGMHWHLHKDGASHFRKYKAMGKRMPVTVTLGGDPILTYAATAPLPPFIDEMLMAGIIRKKGVKLVRSLTNDIWIPEGSDIVIEGYVDPEEALRMEGPFGDHTGFYSLADLYPVFHVTAITHRRDAVYPTTIVGIPPQEDLWLGKATGLIFRLPLRKAVAPELVDMQMPAEGVFHNMVLASVKASFPGVPQKVASALWGAGQMMFNKVMVLFPEPVNLDDPQKVLATIASSVDPARDLFFQKGPLDVLDHASGSFAFGGKMGVDATIARALPGATLPEQTDLDALLQLQGVVSVSGQAIRSGLPLMLIFVDKQTGTSVRELHRIISPRLLKNHIRFAAYMDATAATFSLSDCLWLMAGNIDPERDFLRADFDAGVVVAGFDGTRKTLENDGFTREWPNPVVMDASTIETVNRRWKEYRLGSDPGSPSLKYASYMTGYGAVAGRGLVTDPGSERE